jgi:hypothetical protein
MRFGAAQVWQVFTSWVHLVVPFRVHKHFKERVLLAQQVQFLYLLHLRPYINQQPIGYIFQIVYLVFNFYQIIK